MGLNAWLGVSTFLDTALDDEDRAYDTARRIAEQSSSVAFIRAGVSQASQTVRLEPLTTRRESVDPAGNQAVRRDMLITGYRDHPSLTNTSIQRGDRFFHAGQMFEVVDVLVETPGRLLAFANATGERRTA